MFAISCAGFGKKVTSGLLFVVIVYIPNGNEDDFHIPLPCVAANKSDEGTPLEYCVNCFSIKVGTLGKPVKSGVQVVPASFDVKSPSSVPIIIAFGFHL